MLTGAIARWLFSDLWEIWCDKLTGMGCLPGGSPTEGEKKPLWPCFIVLFSAKYGPAPIS